MWVELVVDSCSCSMGLIPPFTTFLNSNSTCHLVQAQWCNSVVVCALNLQDFQSEDCWLIYMYVQFTSFCPALISACIVLFL